MAGLFTAPPTWQADDSSSSCAICECEFSWLLKRRHHCRACGKLVCDECSRHTAVLPDTVERSRTPQRVCDICHKLIKVASASPRAADAPAQSQYRPSGHRSSFSHLMHLPAHGGDQTSSAPSSGSPVVKTVPAPVAAGAVPVSAAAAPAAPTVTEEKVAKKTEPKSTPSAAAPTPETTAAAETSAPEAAPEAAASSTKAADSRPSLSVVASSHAPQSPSSAAAAPTTPSHVSRVARNRLQNASLRGTLKRGTMAAALEAGADSSAAAGAAGAGGMGSPSASGTTTPAVMSPGGVRINSTLSAAERLRAFRAARNTRRVSAALEAGPDAAVGDDAGEVSVPAAIAETADPAPAAAAAETAAPAAAAAATRPAVADRMARMRAAAGARALRTQQQQQLQQQQPAEEAPAAAAPAAETAAATETPAAAAPAAPAATGVVELQPDTLELVDLFNGLWTQNAPIVVDTRPLSAYAHAHIPRAVSIPISADDVARGVGLDELTARVPVAADGRSWRLRARRIVYVYGGAPPAVADGGTKGRAVAAAEVEYLARLLLEEGRVAGVSVLPAGADAFIQRYPFLPCKTSTVDAVGTHTHTGRFPGFPSEVVDGAIFIGTKTDAADGAHLEALGVTHVLNASIETPNYHEESGKVKYLKLQLEDVDDQDMSAAFDQAFDFLDRALGAGAADADDTADEIPAEGGKVLVHCQMGVSRSASLVIGYVMRAYHCSLLHALAMVRARRQQVLPNKGFLVQLARLERRIFADDANADAAAAAGEAPPPGGSLAACLQQLYPSLQAEEIAAYVAKV